VVTAAALELGPGTYLTPGLPCGALYGNICFLNNSMDYTE